jgi:hypothetical protein
MKKDLKSLNQSDNISENAELFLKGQCHEIFCFLFFHEPVFPQPQSIPLGPMGETDS